MAIIERPAGDGSARYVVRVRDSVGRWFPAKTFRRRIDAERYKRGLEASKDNGGAAIPREVREVTVNSYFAEWWQQRAHKLSKGWHVSVGQMAQDYVLPHIGTMRLSAVRPQHVGQILAEMARLERSQQMRLHVYALLRQMFCDAVEYYALLPSSPVMKRDRPKIHRVERQHLTPDDSWRLIRAAEGHYLEPAIWIALMAGLRPSEVQALRWSAVDFEKRQILVCAAFKRRIGVIEDYPKQKDWGLVSMPLALVEFLRSRRGGSDDFVAPAARGGMLEQKKLHDGLKALCRLAACYYPLLLTSFRGA